MKLNNDRFIFRKIGKYGKKCHIFPRTYAGKALCWRGPGSKEPCIGVKKEDICKECLEEHRIVKHSASYSMLFG